MNAILTKYLKDFSAPEPIEPVGNDFFDIPDTPVDDGGLFFEEEPQIDLEEERRLAREAGYAEAEAILMQKHAEELEALRQAHSEELRAAAERHEHDLVWMIHTRFHEMAQSLSQTIADHTLQVLQPLFEEEVCKRSVGQLADIIKRSFLDQPSATIVVRGPTGLYERLKLLIEGQGIECRFIESATPDISVEINETVLVTRIDNWSKAISEAVE